LDAECGDTAAGLLADAEERSGRSGDGNDLHRCAERQRMDGECGSNSAGGVDELLVDLPVLLDEEMWRREVGVRLEH
jgi:hypothetical protein